MRRFSPDVVLPQRDVFADFETVLNKIAGYLPPHARPIFPLLPEDSPLSAGRVDFWTPSTLKRPSSRDSSVGSTLGVASFSAKPVDSSAGLAVLSASTLSSPVCASA